MQQDQPRRPLRRSSGQRPLQQYRLYFREGSDSHFSYSHEFEAEDDERALGIAEGWLEGRGAELWCGKRKIKNWDAGR